MSAITLSVNGRTHTLDVDPSTALFYVLSDDLELNGPKFGCGSTCPCDWPETPRSRRPHAHAHTA